MVIVNPQGSAILGPGSEWFWAMAQFIVVVVTLFAIFRQLRTEAAANALAQVESLDRWYRSREIAVAELQAAIDQRRGVAPPQVDARMLVIAQFFSDGDRLRLIRSNAASLLRPFHLCMIAGAIFLAGSLQ